MFYNSRFSLVIFSILAGGTLFGASCYISQPECKKFPNYAGVFKDLYSGPNVEKANCFKRPMNFIDWCGNNPGSVSVATFIDDWGKADTHTVIGAGCLILQNECVRFPAYKGSYVDYYYYGVGGSGKEHCFKRARDFAIWCENPVGQATTSIFTDLYGKSEATIYFVR